MDRRELLQGALSIGAITATGLMTGVASADVQQLGPPNAMGLIPMRVFVKQPKVVKQQCQLWCWAASISMIFDSYGHPLDQKKIVQTAFNGQTVCTTGHPTQIGQLLSRSWVDDNGKPFTSQVVAAYDYHNGVFALGNDFIANHLAANHPLLYCNKHHAMVQVTYEYWGMPNGPNGLPMGPPQPPMQIGVLDPWPASPDFHLLNQAELTAANYGGDMTFLAAVNIT